MNKRARNERLIAERKRNCWTQEEAARKAGISISSLKNAERGQTPGHLVARKLLELYRLNNPSLTYDGLFYLPEVRTISSDDATTIPQEATHA